ncbi:MAG: DUF2071 domain-containing protein [Planctomycetia bacterium]|nr:DUF2071 domain-containing protein [Planctomycetia bacterium]
MGLPDASHRPWPLPEGSWATRQTWSALAFLHWRVPADAVRQAVGPGVEVDTFDGSAWLGVVPFRMSGVRLRWLPPVPGTAAFPELNVRTYVKRDGKPGVWFLSLDATNLSAIAVARAWFGLPYRRSRMEVTEEEGRVSYDSVRDDPGAPPAVFRARYAPSGGEFRARPGTLEHFLSERYCLYTEVRGGLLRAEIHHAPWELRPARVAVRENSMARAAGFDVAPAPEHALYARTIDAWIWGPRRIG